VLLFILLAVFVTHIYINPSSRFNPFPPPTLAATIELPTLEESRQPTHTTAAPTRTPTPTMTTTASPSPTRTATEEPTPEGGAHNPATTPIPTKTLDIGFHFTLHGEQKMLDASTFDVKHGCSWQGVAGQTFDLLNRPLPGILVQVSGTLGAEKLEMISMSGTVLTYGPAGYEIFLSNKAIESHDSLFIRLIDEAGKPLSAQYELETSGDCRRNLVVVNFKKVQ
jgi:hypothetical protein